MSMEFIYRLSVIVSMLDQFSGPSARINRTLNSNAASSQNFNADIAKIARGSFILLGSGKEIAEWSAALIKSILTTQDTLAELASLGVSAEPKRNPGPKHQLRARIPLIKMPGKYL